MNDIIFCEGAKSFLKKGKYVSNISELWLDCNSPLYFYMKLCGVKEKYLDEKQSSDYERFSCLCEIFSKLIGNDIYKIAKAELKIIWGCELEISPENAPDIWRATCDKSVFDMLKSTGNSRYLLPQDICKELSEDDFINGTKIMHSLDNIQSIPLKNTEELDALIDKKASERDQLFFADMRGYKFEKPSKYSVDKALSAKERPHDLLITQALRSAARACRTHGGRIVLHASLDSELYSLLGYLHSWDGADILLLPYCTDARDAKKFLLSLSDGVLKMIEPTMISGSGDHFETISNYAKHLPIGALKNINVPLDDRLCISALTPVTSAAMSSAAFEKFRLENL